MYLPYTPNNTTLNPVLSCVRPLRQYTVSTQQASLAIVPFWFGGSRQGWRFPLRTIRYLPTSGERYTGHKILLNDRWFFFSEGPHGRTLKAHLSRWSTHPAFVYWPFGTNSLNKSSPQVVCNWTLSLIKIEPVFKATLKGASCRYIEGDELWQKRCTNLRNWCIIWKSKPVKKLKGILTNLANLASVRKTFCAKRVHVVNYRVFR